MKTLALVLSLAFSVAALAENIVVRVTDAGGLPVQGADVVAILKSGAYQDAKVDPADGQHKCQPTEACVKVYAAAPGYEAATKKYSGTPGVFTVALKANPGKSSAVIRGSGPLPGLDGTVNPILATSGSMVLYTAKIGLETGGRAAKQPVHFSLNRAIDAVTPTGQKFKIYVVDILPTVSLLEFTTPN